jgi:hypothetical protein
MGCFAVTLSPSKGLGFVIASETTQSRKNLWIAALPSVVRDDVRELYSTRFTNFVQAKGDYPR